MRRWENGRRAQRGVFSHGINSVGGASCLDFRTGNISFYTDGGDAVVELEKIAPYVACTHMKDHDGVFDAWHFKTLGEGIVDFAEILRILKSVDYTGPYILQPEGVRGEELTEAQTKEQIEKSFEHLRQLGYGD
jgi:sugar phosphate isomerase/epimerase